LFNSFLQGLHQVAQKQINVGFPSCASVAVLMVFPFRSFRLMQGRVS
jgi:hypothetical protein